MTQINFLERAKRLWVDRFQGARTANIFHLYIQAGKEEWGFVMDITGAKRLAKLLKQQVEVYEKEAGVILDDRLDNDPLPTPLEGFGGTQNKPKK